MIRSLWCTFPSMSVRDLRQPFLHKVQLWSTKSVYQRSKPPCRSKPWCAHVCVLFCCHGHYCCQLKVQCATKCRHARLMLTPQKHPQASATKFARCSSHQSDKTKWSERLSNGWRQVVSARHCQGSATTFVWDLPSPKNRIAHAISADSASHFFIYSCTPKALLYYTLYSPKWFINDWGSSE